MISAKKCISNGGTSGPLKEIFLGGGPTRRPILDRMCVCGEGGLGLNLGTRAFLAAPTHSLLLE